MLISNNQTQTSVEKFNKEGTFVKEPILDFFIERYDQAYKSQLNDFINKIREHKKPSVTYEDGQSALILANAAYESLEKNTTIKL